MQVAVQDGQYDRVAVLARWAEQLSEIMVIRSIPALETKTATSARTTASNGAARRPTGRKKGKNH
jgi:hypothetical protein